MSISLLERMSSAGPVRTKHSPRTSEPYNRADRAHSKGDVEGTWSHDMFDGNSLQARLSRGGAVARPTPTATAVGGRGAVRIGGLAQKALSNVAGGASSSINIKGAGSTKPNVVQVSGLVAGTTAQDVEAIFKQCGPITLCKLHSAPGAEDVAIRVTFKEPAAAAEAIKKFHGQPADGKNLVVKSVGAATTGIVGRFQGAAGETVRNLGSVDILMDGGSAGGSKMRSDEIQDVRAQILVAPPGQPISDYVPRAPRGGRGRRGGRGGGRGGKR